MQFRVDVIEDQRPVRLLLEAGDAADARSQADGRRDGPAHELLIDQLRLFFLIAQRKHGIKCSPSANSKVHNLSMLRSEAVLRALANAIEDKACRRRPKMPNALTNCHVGGGHPPRAGE